MDDKNVFLIFVARLAHGFIEWYTSSIFLSRRPGGKNETYFNNYMHDGFVNAQR
jgi:hypothetical protein